MFFEKYHGLGNDFVIVELPDLKPLTTENVIQLCDRRTGIGCDQLMVILPPTDGEGCHAKVRIYNTDGSEAEACGNGTRCVVHFLAQKTPLTSSLTLDTPSGMLKGEFIQTGLAKVQQGYPQMLSQEPLNLNDYGLEGVQAYAVSVGNPHLVILNCNPRQLEDFKSFGSKLEHHPAFPNRCNVEFCEVDQNNPRNISVRMWERGAGHTRACGSGACAVAFVVLRLVIREARGEVRIDMEGGSLKVSIDDRGCVTHEGEAQFVFKGDYPI